MTDCVECGDYIKTKLKIYHPDFPGDALCIECAPNIYQGKVEKALYAYSEIMEDIVAEKSR